MQIDGGGREVVLVLVSIIYMMSDRNEDNASVVRVYTKLRRCVSLCCLCIPIWIVYDRRSQSKETG